ncbi:MAG TPA: hypothetical protein VG713_22150 [Pirellulales bacterium]|nr:hypothetical protein [Pirellulales bacterium]
MTTILRDTPDATTTFRDYRIADVDYTLSYSPLVQPSGGGSQSTVDDVIYNVVTGTTKTNAAIAAIPTGNLSTGALDGSTLENLDPDLASFDPSTGIVTANDASATVRILCKAKIQRQIQVPVTVATQTTSTFAEFAAGSLAKAAKDAIDTALGAMGPTDYQNLAKWKMWNQVGLNVTINAAGWHHPFDLTCVPWGNSYSGNAQHAGTLVSPRHILMADHYALVAPCEIYFVDPSGIRTFNVLECRKVGLTDFNVGILDADAPSSIKPAVVPPANIWTAYCPAGFTTLNVPVILTNQDRMAYVGVLNILDQSPPAGAAGASVAVYRSTDATEGLWAYGVRTGDSGHPIIMPVGSQTMILSVWGGGNPAAAWVGDGTDVSANIDGINATMHALSVAHSLSSDYQLTVADLSAYESY